MPRLQRVLVVCAPCLAFVPCPTIVHAHVAAPPGVERDSDSELGSIELARALLAEGRRSYAARDFVRAAEQWELAYSLMTGIETLRADAYALAFDLGEAHMHAWELDPDAERLSRARIHLGEFVAWVGHAEHTLDATMREDRRRAVELLARIDAIQLATRSDPPPPPPAVSRAAPRGSDRRRSEVARPWIIAGSAALVGSVAAIVVAAAAETIGDRDVEAYADFLDRQRRTRSLQAGAGVTAGLLGIAGASMLTVGLLRRRHAIVAAPMLSSTSAGAQVRVAW